MKTRHILRPIWAVTSPILIHLGMLSTIFTILITVDSQLFEANPHAFLDRHVPWATFAATVICIPIFLLMWRKTRNSIPLPANKSNALRIGTTLLVCAFSVMLVFAVNSIINVAVFGIHTRYYLGLESVSPFWAFASAGGLEIWYHDSVLALISIFTGVVMQELLYRGIVLNRLMIYTPNWLAVLLSSAIWGVFSIGSNTPVQTVHTMVLYILLALIYLRYRNLLLCIIAHLVMVFTSTSPALCAFCYSMAFNYPVFSIVMPIIYMIGIGGLLLLTCPQATFEEKPTE